MSSLWALVVAVAEAPEAASAAVELPQGGSYGLFLIETLVILIAVCGLAYLVLRFGVRRLYGGAQAPRSGAVQVLERVPIEPRRTLYVVAVGGKTLLLGASDGAAMAVLAELDGDAVTRAQAAAPPRASFLEILRARRAAPEPSPASAKPVAAASPSPSPPSSAAEPSAEDRRG